VLFFARHPREGRDPVTLPGRHERRWIPAFAGMTSNGKINSCLTSQLTTSSSPRRRGSSDFASRHERRWIPVFAGMTSGGRIPAFAGMTNEELLGEQRSKLRSTKHGFSIRLPITAPSSPRRRGSSDSAVSSRKTLDSRLRGNDETGVALESSEASRPIGSGPPSPCRICARRPTWRLPSSPHRIRR